MKRPRENKRRAGPADDAPLTAAELRTARSTREAMPHIIETIGKRGRPKGQSKTQVTLRLDNDLIRTLRATGDGWQTRVNGLLRAAIGLRR
ncbi:unnamed protein product [Phaeothamnion confervicola]